MFELGVGYEDPPDLGGVFRSENRKEGRVDDGCKFIPDSIEEGEGKEEVLEDEGVE